jgi:pyruvate formate lyase activating enzyme
MKEAELYEHRAGGRVRCTACPRYCQLAEGQTGFCGMRQNIGGRLYLLTYGKVLAAHIDPIEKKPVTHYRPGTRIFSIGTAGCDFMCRYCINFDLSQRRTVGGEDVDALAIPKLAVSQGCEGIAFTYNEPTIFIEFAKDVGVEAHRNGLFNIFVTNGFATPEAVDMMGQFLDCATVDFKGNGETSFQRKYVGIPNANRIYETLLEIRDKTKIHIEITDLVVPGVGDSLEEAKKVSTWVYDNLGPETPMHFLRFFPSYRMLDIPETPIATLEAHYRTARKAGLQYVYIGNVPGHPYESTYCPGCKNVVVGRVGTDIVGWFLDADNKCKFCGARISITGKLPEAYADERFLPAYLA